MNRFIGVIILLMPFVLTACQTLSKEECVAANWSVIGEQDGAAGHDPQQRFGKHAKACEKAGIVPDQTLWNEGYNRGLVRFCTPLSGLRHGEQGKPYANVCPAGTDAGFRSGYALGLKKSRKEREVSSLRSDISGKEFEIRENDRKVNEGKLTRAAATPLNDRLYSDINWLNRDLGRTQAELIQIETEISAFRASQAGLTQ